MNKLFFSDKYDIFTNTCKFWKCISKNPDLHDYFVFFTTSNMATHEEINGKVTYYYFSLDVREFMKVNGGWNKWDIHLIEDYGKYKDREHTRQRLKELVELLIRVKC